MAFEAVVKLRLTLRGAEVLHYAAEKSESDRVHLTVDLNQAKFVALGDSRTLDDQRVNAEISTPNDISTPRWGHWYQRKLARVWYATLLGLNIEPTVMARVALQKQDKQLYQTYVIA